MEEMTMRLTSAGSSIVFPAWSVTVRVPPVCAEETASDGAAASEEVWFAVPAQPPRAEVSMIALTAAERILFENLNMFYQLSLTGACLNAE